MPTTPLATPIPLSQPDAAQAVKEEVRDLLASIGMQEIITYSMVSGQALELAHRGVDPATSPMRAFNPISAEHEFLRTSLRPGLLRTLAANQRHEGLPQWYFEVGKEFLFYGEGLPDERQKAAGVLSGPGAQASWAAQEAAAGFYDARGRGGVAVHAAGRYTVVRAAGRPLLLPRARGGSLRGRATYRRAWRGAPGGAGVIRRAR